MLEQRCDSVLQEQPVLFVTKHWLLSKILRHLTNIFGLGGRHMCRSPKKTTFLANSFYQVSEISCYIDSSSIGVNENINVGPTSISCYQPCVQESHSYQDKQHDKNNSWFVGYRLACAPLKGVQYVLAAVLFCGTVCVLFISRSDATKTLFMNLQLFIIRIQSITIRLIGKQVRRAESELCLKSCL